MSVHPRPALAVRVTARHGKAGSCPTGRLVIMEHGEAVPSRELIAELAEAVRAECDQLAPGDAAEITVSVLAS